MYPGRDVHVKVKTEKDTASPSMIQSARCRARQAGDVLIRAPAGRAAKFLDVKLGQYRQANLLDAKLAWELLHDGVRQRVGDHRHMTSGSAQGGVCLDHIAGGLGVDDVFEGQDVGFDQVSDDVLGQIGIGRVWFSSLRS